MTSSKKKSASLRIRHDAHIDEAYTEHGYVSKLVHIVVSDADAALMLADHNYLEQVTED